jgi:hypothetical protein
LDVEVTSSNGAPTREKVVFKGALSTPLRIQIQSFAMIGGAEYIIQYKFASGGATCASGALAGCRKYDAVAARQTATQWSKWANHEYGGVEKAWRELAASYADIDVVPWHRWYALWRHWGHQDNMPADAQAVFKYITGGGMESGVSVVDKDSFTFAYDLLSTATFNANCCSKVRMGYSDEATAWGAFTATHGASSDLYIGITSTIYSVCQPLAGDQAEIMRKYWPRYIEENGQPGIQEQEFRSCWTTGLECPRYKYFRTQALLFGCQPETGRITIFLPEESVGDIPANLLSLNLTVQVPNAASQFALKDAQSDNYAVKADGAPCSNDHHDCHYNGAGLSWSGNVQGTGASGPVGWASASFKDPTPTPLTLEVSSGDGSVREAEITFSYDGYKQCPNGPDSDIPDVPSGCSYIDPSKVPAENCMKFSSFLQQRHSNLNGLLQYLSENKLLESTALGSGVPFHTWPRLWSDWKGNGDTGTMWQECFHWCDENSDGLIVQTELEQCFLLSRTHNGVGIFCGDLCHTYPNQDALWANWANGANVISAGRWDTLWNSNAKVSNTGVSSLHSFRYVDGDANGGITHDEFKACYGASHCGSSWPLIGSILQGAGAAAKASNMPETQDQPTGAEGQQQAGPPELSPQAEASTTLTADVAVGVTVLPVASSSGFFVGREIVIDANTAAEEVNVIASIGSLVLKTPLQHPHSKGAPITMPKVSDIPQEPADVTTSSAAVPLYVWIILAIVLLVCLGLLIVLAAAPFFFRGKKRTTVSSIGDDDAGDIDDRYSNLNLEGMEPAISDSSQINSPRGALSPFMAAGPQFTSFQPVTTTTVGTPSMPSMRGQAPMLAATPVQRTASGSIPPTPVSQTFSPYPGGAVPRSGGFVPYPSSGYGGSVV